MFQIDDKQVGKEFERIAEALLLRKKLVVNHASYKFTEIEFYYHSKDHPDPNTHNHNFDAGKWRFHNQGLDITLRGNDGSGGILIRGVEEIVNETNQFINGPRRVIFSVTQYFNSVEKLNNRFGIEDTKPENQFVYKTFRHGLTKKDSNLKGDNAIDFINAKYRFIVKPDKFDRKQFSGSEAIAKSFDNNELAYQFLGYNLNK